MDNCDELLSCRSLSDRRVLEVVVDEDCFGLGPPPNERNTVGRKLRFLITMVVVLVGFDCLEKPVLDGLENGNLVRRGSVGVVRIVVVRFESALGGHHACIHAFSSHGPGMSRHTCVLLVRQSR